TAGPQLCVRALICVYDHPQRELPKRLTREFHDHHDLARATLHVHLDHDSCMEVTVLKGAGEDVQELADHVIAERGVRHGQVVYLPAAPYGSRWPAPRNRPPHPPPPPPPYSPSAS